MSKIKDTKKTRITVLRGDITKLKVDAIVNAANNSLLGGAGVDGAIHQAGGPEILEECRKIGSCETGEAVITTAGRLPAKYVIHTVGPVWSNGRQGEKEKLAACYRNSLSLAAETGCETIAFPNISTGLYHFPKKEAAKVAVSTIQEFLKENDSLRQVVLVCFNEENFSILKSQLDAAND